MTIHSRRSQIAGAAIEVLATGGARVLTHSAVDQHLGLARGSTSYYFRTRRSLVIAAAEELIARSRERFGRLTFDMSEEPTPESATERIATYLHHLCTVRQSDLRARLALLPEVDTDLQKLLARAFFSLESAYALCQALGHSDPQESADCLVDLLEGAALRATFSTSPKTVEKASQIGRILSHT